MREYIIPLIGILAITGIVLGALSQGIDGAVMSMGIALVAGIAGYKASTIKGKRKKG